MIVAIFGTTISPYLFFWQASEEVEEIETHADQHALKDAPGEAREELRRIGWDTYIGMGYSNLIAFFVILATAVTLNAHGVTNIQTASQAALALKPIAGDSRLRPVRPRHHRHRPARHPDAGRLGGLCPQRGAWAGARGWS